MLLAGLAHAAEPPRYEHWQYRRTGWLTATPISSASAATMCWTGQVEATADDVRVRYAEGEAPLVRRYAETRYGARSWKSERRVSAAMLFGGRRIDSACRWPACDGGCGISGTRVRL